MKFSVSLSEFQELLTKTLPAIPPKSTLPVLEHLHFSLSENTLRVIATDQDITIMSVINVNSETDGKILVPGRRLNEIVKLLGTEGDITFNANLDNYEIKLTIKNGVYTMKGLNPEEYLDIPELFDSKKPDIESDKDILNNKLNATIDKDSLIRLATKTVFAVSNDEFRPAMTGVLLQFREDCLTAVATDSYRLSRIVQKSEKAIYPKELDIILPSRSVELLKKVDNDVVMSVIETHSKITHARFDFGDTVFITRIIDEKFPPYESVIPKNNELIAVIDQRELSSAIRRVSIFTSSISKQVKISLKENLLYISGRDEEFGTDGDEKIPCDYTGTNIEIGFNYKYLEEALQNIEVSDENDYQVELSFSEPTRPVLVKTKTGADDLLMLIMPVRIT